MDEKEKGPLTHDKACKLYGYMTSNMAKIFNSFVGVLCTSK
jgi:hypothetical protein